MPAIAIAAVATAAGTAIKANAQKKAAQAVTSAAEKAKVDVDTVDAKVREIARRNAEQSIALEKELSPETYELRRQSTEALIQNINPTAYDEAVRAAYLGEMYGDGVTAERVSLPEFQKSALAKAASEQAMEDLRLGGTLDTQTRNEVMRKAAATTGMATGGLGLGRDVSARDLGVSALQLRESRMNRAQQIGAAEDALALNQQQMGLQAGQFNAGQSLTAQLQNRANRLSATQGLANVNQNLFGRQFNVAQLGQSIQRPQIGLDPSQAVDIMTGNTNRQYNAAVQAAQMKGAAKASLGTGLSQVGGIVAGGYGKAGGWGSGS